MDDARHADGTLRLAALLREVNTLLADAARLRAAFATLIKGEQQDGTDSTDSL